LTVAHALLAQFFFVKAGLPQLSTLSRSIVRTTLVAIVAAIIIISYWLRRGRAVLGSNDKPTSVRPLLITAIVVIAVTAWSRCALRSNGGPGSATDNRTSRCPTAAAYCAAEDRARSAAQYRPGLAGPAQLHPARASQEQWQERLRPPQLESSRSP